MSGDPTLFQTVASCPATREAVAIYEPGYGGCPLCGAPSTEHYSEKADVIRDVGDDFGAWLLSLPRTP